MSTRSPRCRAAKRDAGESTSEPDAGDAINVARTRLPGVVVEIRVEAAGDRQPAAAIRAVAEEVDAAAIVCGARPGNPETHRKPETAGDPPGSTIRALLAAADRAVVVVPLRLSSEILPVPGTCAVAASRDISLGFTGTAAGFNPVAVEAGGMSASELAAAVQEALAVDGEAFQERALAEAEDLKREVREGTFDNTQAIVGLELELYAVDARTDALRRVPRQLLGLIGFEKELGLHNAEMQTSPAPLSHYGLVAQEAGLQAHLDPAEAKVAVEDIRLVADGMWTVPPTGETASEYLTDCVASDGVTISTNMSDSVRYHAMANTDYPTGCRLDAPHVSLDAETVMPESLITSIQPHYQVAHAPDLPTYFAYALRVAAPLLALGVNSPFFPPDLYDDAPDAEIVADAHMEHRIGVFESVLNPPQGHDEAPKVCFPPDFETVEDAIDAVAADRTIVPMEVEHGGRFDDRFAHFRHKHGSYWRWIRPVFDGATRSAANARIEFRPLPAQPTIRDAIAFQAVFAGLMESLATHEHPVRNLDWATAEANFYAATRDGLQADIDWLTADGDRTTDIDAICGECFEYAREGLEQRGLATEEARRYIRPLRERLDRRLTPARWKHHRVRRAVEDNVPLAEAIWGMQSAYVDHQEGTLIEGTFVDWLEG